MKTATALSHRTGLLNFVGACLLLVSLQAGATAGHRGIAIDLKVSEDPTAGIEETSHELYTESYALVVGIDDYTNGWPKLGNAIKDAELIAGALKERGFEVTYHTDLTSDQMEDIFKEFFIIKGDNPNARLFVWFAGHGHTLNGEGYLVPGDAPVPTEEAEFKFSSLNMRKFGTFMRQAKSKHVYAVFDACFAGTVFNSQRAMPPAAITRATTMPVRQFLTSGDDDQTVSDDGTFRQLFLRAIAGEEDADSNNDGYLTASELGLYLGDRITNLTQQAQTPRYGKLRDKDYDRGDFVFVLPGTELDMAGADPEQEKKSAEITFWESVKDSNNVAAFDAYLQQYPDGVFALLANLKKTELQNAGPQGSRTFTQPDPVPGTTQSTVDRVKEQLTALRNTTLGPREDPAPLPVVPPVDEPPVVATPAPDLPLPPVDTRALIANADVADAIRKRMSRYLELAQDGNAMAQFSLGYMFDKGELVEANSRAAEKWYEEAAAQGNTRAQVNLAQIYETGGDNVGQNWDKAISLYRQAAESGDASAQEKLGYLYEHGVGLSADPFAAADYYLRAAEQGMVTAQNNLGRLYQLGTGVKQDNQQAAYWYEKAAAQGSEAARVNLEKLKTP